MTNKKQGWKLALICIHLQFRLDGNLATVTLKTVFLLGLSLCEFNTLVRE